MRRRQAKPNDSFDSPGLAGFGVRLREAFGGAKNVEIARELQVTEAAVRNYLEGRVPSAEQLVRISQRTKRSIDWLLKGTVEGIENRGVGAFLSEAEEQAIQEIGAEAGEEFNLTLRRLVRDRLRSMGKLPPEAEPIRVDYYGAEWTDVPLLGQVAAGSPIELFEFKETARVIKTWPESKKVHALRVSDDSMQDSGLDGGDLIVCMEASEARRGQLVVALIDGTRATVKRFYRDNGTVILQTENAKQEPEKYDASRVNIHGPVESIIRSAARPIA